MYGAVVRAKLWGGSSGSRLTIMVADDADLVSGCLCVCPSPKNIHRPSFIFQPVREQQWCVRQSVEEARIGPHAVDMARTIRNFGIAGVLRRFLEQGKMRQMFLLSIAFGRVRSRGKSRLVLWSGMLPQRSPPRSESTHSSARSVVMGLVE